MLTKHGPDFGSMLGADIEVLDDIDHDGVPEIAVGMPGFRPWWAAFPLGAVRVYSGASGTDLWTWTGTAPGTEAGHSLVRLGDFDGDGIDELAVGGAGTVAREGYCAVISGMSGQLLREHFGATVNQYSRDFGDCILGISDVDGDGIRDYLVSDPWSGVPATGGPGSVTCFSGANGAQIWQTPGIVTAAGFGDSLAEVADWTGDQVPDLAIAAWNSGTGAVHVLNAVTGAFVGALPVPQGVQWSFGASLASGVDWDHDGVDEILIGSDSALHLVNSRTGVVVWGLAIDLPIALEVVGDLDQDGLPDLVAGVLSSAQVQRLEVLSGLDGECIRVFDEPAPMAGIASSGVAAVDRSGDGIPELLLGARDWDVLPGGREGGIQMHRFSPYIYSRQTSYSVSASGPLVFDVDFPIAAAGQQAVLLASNTGRGPTVVGGLQVPLSADNVLAFTSSTAVPQWAATMRGTLNGEGDAVLGLSSAGSALSAMVGSSLYFSAVRVAAGAPVQASSAVTVEVVP